MAYILLANHYLRDIVQLKRRLCELCGENDGLQLRINDLERVVAELRQENRKLEDKVYTGEELAKVYEAMLREAFSTPGERIEGAPELTEIDKAEKGKKGKKGKHYIQKSCMNCMHYFEAKNSHEYYCLKKEFILESYIPCEHWGLRLCK